MIYQLKDCRTGGEAIYPTTVEITEQGGVLNVKFVAEHTAYFCPHHGTYNAIHSEGDACEVLIGSDPKRETYYEIEISARGDLMLAKMGYGGVGEGGEPILDIGFVENCFVRGQVTRTETGYIAELSFKKEDIMTGEGEVYFNAYRLDTDGEQMDRHLFALNPTMRPKFHAPDYYVSLKDYVNQ